MLIQFLRTVQQILRTFAQALASEVTLVYKYDTSCPSLDAILTGDTKIKGTAVYWSGDRQLECDVEQPIVAQIGGVDVSPEACVPGYSGSPNLVDEPGPAQVFMFTVPKASSQTSISAEAAYNVWGFGAESGVEPWVVPNLIFKRFFDSGVQQVIAATIRLPMTAWRGTAIKGSGEMKPALLASSAPERTIGITSADQADAQDARANLRTLAYQHYEQSCGYLPDSTPGSFDKKNVRDGHYTLWAPYHFYSRKSDRMNDERIANVINYFTGAKRLPNPNTDLITTLKQGGLVPSCAMRVQREKEGSTIRPYKPSPSCGCYYDITSPGGYTPPECASCRTDRDTEYDARYSIMTPFGIASKEPYQAPPPPSLTSVTYTAAFIDAKAVGTPDERVSYRACISSSRSMRRWHRVAASAARLARRA